uniref:Reverse transcriptase Ty1/copia-type domain-containing protein n=1 Tax=Tanacetum cinerariifolium TaxID=118510 RepID=A0A6L2JCG0_TANCI|nr:hypothetical protein [Tanacetum cinerariifolium]
METLNEAAKKDDAIPDNNNPQNEQQEVNGDKEVPENSGNSNPTASTKVSANDSFELASISTVETEVPTVSTHVPTDSLYDPPVTSSVPKIISRRGSSFPEPLSLGNAMSFENRLEDFFGDTSNAVSLNEPPGFQDLEFPHKVYKRYHRSDIVYQEAQKRVLLVQVYVNDIIFGSSNPKLCREFKALMHDKFQMSAMSKLNFFLGLQVLQIKDGIFLSQDKYVGDILKKIRYTDIREVKTPMDRENPCGKDGTGKDVELHLYRSLIGSLMYLNASRPDFMFFVCAYARHQVTPKECHLHVVKRIFRYLKGNPKLGLWYPKESPFDLVAYSDNDYGGANQDRKSTTRGC